MFPDQEARRQAEEAQRKEQMARQTAQLKARQEAEAAARRKASLEAKLKAEQEVRLKAAQERQRKAEEAAAEEAQRKEQMARQADMLKAQQEADAKRRAQEAEAQRWIAMAAQHRAAQAQQTADRERLVQTAPGVWARVGEYPENGGAQAGAQKSNGLVCTPDNPRGNPFYDPTALDNIEQHKVTTIGIPRYVPGEPTIDPPGHDKAVQGNRLIALAEFIGIINDMVGPHAPPATSDIHTYLYRSVYENGDVRFPGLAIVNTSGTPMHLDHIEFIIDRSGNPAMPLKPDLDNLKVPLPDEVRFDIDESIVISPGATETIEIPVEILPHNQPIIGTSIYLRVYLKDLGVRVIKVDFP